MNKTVVSSTEGFGLSFLLPVCLTPAKYEYSIRIFNRVLVSLNLIYGNRIYGQILNADNADDVYSVDLTQVHYLWGLFEFKTVEQGDLLHTKVMDIQSFEDRKWVFTGVFDRDKGGGFLDEIYLSAYVVLSSFCASFRGTKINNFLFL